MLDSDLDCGDECGGPGPPPEFLIPPPPRPPFLQELTKCSEDPLPDVEMCEAIPVSILIFLILFIDHLPFHHHHLFVLSQFLAIHKFTLN